MPNYGICFKHGFAVTRCETFCSTCTSTGLAACTRRACLDTCSLPPESGLCDAYFPSYYFNRRTMLCERFVYGGCGGNDNRFRTAEECYRRCSPSSELVELSLIYISNFGKMSGVPYSRTFLWGAELSLLLDA